MKSIRNVLWRGLSCLVIALSPSILSAQGAFCGTWYTFPCAPGQHTVGGASGGPIDGRHEDCRDASQEWIYDHISCNPEEQDVQPMDVPAYAAALEAFSAEDVGAAMEFASDLPLFVTYNAERGAVQLRDCIGQALVASFR